MLKLIFALLLAANAALFAYSRGYLGQINGNDREPARLQKQQNADKLQLISASKAESAAAAVAPPPPVPRDEPAPVACFEVGDFPQADARKFEERLAPLQLGDRQQRRNVPGQEISSYIVHIPPQASRAAAEKKADELRALGITNFFVLNESSPLKWGISLGVFRTEAAAQAQLAALNKQGVQSARVAPRYTANHEQFFQFRDMSEEGKARITKIAAKFPEQEIRACSANAR